MIYNFKTVEDNQQWVVDVEALTWARASSIIAAPSVEAAEHNLARFVAAEEGKLAPMGAGRYVFVGRKLTGANGQPQIAIFTVASIPVKDDDGKIVLVTLMQSNVDIKDGQQEQIQKFKVECLPAARRPQPKMTMEMPPITAEEAKAVVDATVTPTEPEKPNDDAA